MDELQVLRRHAAALMNRSNVVGVGIGRKVRAGRRLPHRCLTVLVSQKLPLQALGSADVIPATIEGLRTDVLESGTVRPLAQTEKMRPARPGLSIGHYRVTAGTFGAVVYDAANGHPLILSNNHVLANSSSGRDRRARVGDPILQPGSHDGGNLADDQIGTLERYIPLNYSPFSATAAAAATMPVNWAALAGQPNQALTNEVDAALAKPLQPDMITPYILGIGVVIGVAQGELDLEVQKSGRTTDYTTGTILVQNVALRVDYGEAGICLFTNQLVSDISSGPGDSGSLVLDMHNRAVGLLFAGGNGLTVVNPIEDVISRLRIVFLPQGSQEAGLGRPERE
ncbi:MAG: hypothetical protein ACOX2K_03610 [Bacillota bacterium]|jgi:hypothetical protein